jgi:uncharacterized protein
MTARPADPPRPLADPDAPPLADPACSLADPDAPSPADAPRPLAIPDAPLPADPARDARAPAFAYPRHRALWPQVAAALGDCDLSHDRSHLARVYRWAVWLADGAGADRDLAGAAALVHDLVNLPKHHPDRADAAAQSARAAPAVLAAAGYGEGEIAEVVEAVRTSSWSAGLAATGPLGRVLQDADRLDAIGAIGVARTFACAQRMVDAGAALALHHADDPLAGDRPADDRRYAVDHFAVKLLRLADAMNLPAAAAEARRRHAGADDQPERD